MRQTRLRAILAAGAGKEKLASALAFETDLSVEAATRVLEAAVAAPVAQDAARSTTEDQYEMGRRAALAAYGRPASEVAPVAGMRSPSMSSSPHSDVQAFAAGKAMAESILNKVVLTSPGGAGSLG